MSSSTVSGRRGESAAANIRWGLVTCGLAGETRDTKVNVLCVLTGLAQVLKINLGCL